MFMEGNLSKFYVCWCSACMCACAHMCSGLRGGKDEGVLDALELELEPVKSL